LILLNNALQLLGVQQRIDLVGSGSSILKCHI